MTDIQKRLYRSEGPVPVGYKDTPIGFLPNEWGYASLGDLSVELTETAGQRTYETVSISAGIGFVNQAEKFGKELSGKQYEKYIVLHKGDFSYNKGNSNRYPQGCIYRLNDREEAAVPNVFESFRIVRGCPEYYEQLFISGFLNHQLFRLINHGVRDDGLLNLTGTDFYSCLLPVPPLREQERIVDLLSTCDSMIGRYEEKAEQYRTLKKHLLNKMFPKEGSAVPEIRFPGLTTPWEQRKIKSLIAEFSTGRSVNSDGDIATPNDIGVLKTSCVSYDSFNAKECKKVAPDEIALVRCPVEKDCIIVSRMNTPERVGSCGLVDRDYPNLYLPDRLWKIKLTNAVNAKMVHSFLVSPCCKAQITAMASGTSGSMYNIPRDRFEELNISIPSSEEQAMIARFFEENNNLITLHQREAEAWRNKKKALSQLLLTGIVRV